MFYIVGTVTVDILIMLFILMLTILAAYHSISVKQFANKSLNVG